MTRPFRFAAVSAPSTPFSQLVQEAKAAEDTGFDLLVLPDFPNTISPIGARCASARWSSTRGYGVRTCWYANSSPPTRSPVAGSTSAWELAWRPAGRPSR
jgi:alkanesulfonate monooxygenase SsuD/methylene tetrahydromethanopterin reductase-like flavin-dependent oxidoreductase (luciferase family)